MTSEEQCYTIAVRPDGQGDVSASHVAWRFGKGAPSKPSMILVNDLLFTVNDAGITGAIDAKNGELIWRARVEGTYSASPIYAGGRIYAFNTGAPEHARKATEQIAQALAPLGIEYAPGKGSAGPDISPFVAKGMAWAWLAQDGSDYFDLHHNADDTLDKIDPVALAQNVAAYTVFAYLAAEADGDFGSQLKE